MRRTYLSPEETIIEEFPNILLTCYSLNTLVLGQLRGPLNCEHEPRGRTCWESAGFRAERPRRLLLSIPFSSFESGLSTSPRRHSHEKSAISRWREFRCPRAPILDSVIVWVVVRIWPHNEKPRHSHEKSAISRCARFGAPREAILGSLRCLLCFFPNDTSVGGHH